MPSPKSRILDAVAALEQGERRRAAALIAQELRAGEQTGDKWASVSKLANKIGEIDLGIEASRRFTMTEPIRLDRLLQHCGALAQIGRSEEGIALLDRLPPQAQQHPGALHFRGTIASEGGDFEKAEALLRQSLKAAPTSPQGWFALTMIKTFEPDDPDFAGMAAVEPHIGTVDPLTQARYFYGMGKALVDMGEVEQGFAYYEKGAAIRRREEPYDRERHKAFAAGLIRDFTEEGMARLVPSRARQQRAIFVNGLPRSGTTLVESILASHSKVTDGAEVNLVQAAMIPTRDNSFDGAIAYQERSKSKDPWGEIAEDYHKMLRMRFPGSGLVVDKTLSQSMVMGLLLHAMPEAQIIWMRRRPEDIALSAYRAFFTSSVSWSWSMEDIAHQMKLEDQLFAHWTALFPDRILTVQYEDMVRDPQRWIPRLLGHVGLEMEEGVLEFHKNRRKVRTASVKQVRSAISTDAIGKSEKFAAQLEPFRAAYYG